jgi:hypothetical protein
VPGATATLDWRLPPAGPGRLMLFETFVTDQRKTADTRHVEDAHLAIAAFRRGMRGPANFQNSVEEPTCLSLLGATMLRTGWETNPSILLYQDPVSSFGPNNTHGTTEGSIRCPKRIFFFPFEPGYILLGL